MRGPVVSTASIGRSREHAVAVELARHGWLKLMRAAASKGSADLLMAHSEYGAMWLQVGSRTKRLGPADRDRFLADAELISALPILAVVIPRQPIRYWHVNAGQPRGWAAWTPEAPA